MLGVTVLPVFTGVPGFSSIFAGGVGVPALLAALGILRLFGVLVPLPGVGVVLVVGIDWNRKLINKTHLGLNHLIVIS